MPTSVPTIWALTKSATSCVSSETPGTLSSST